MKPLTIEIHGTGTHNRGAELMAIAIAERMRATFPDVRLVVPLNFGDHEARSRYGFLSTWEQLPGRVRAAVTSKVLQYTSADFRSAFGIVDPREIDVVLDASGFAFSDQWGPTRAVSLVQKMQLPARRCKPLILLPQAFGPFSDPEVAAVSRALFQRASLICARDTQSYEAVIELGAPAELVRKYPDFTLGTQPHLVPGVKLPKSFAAIVPNMRMIDKGAGVSGYLNFLSRSIRLLQSAGMNPVFVLHDAFEDRAVIQQMASTENQIQVLESADPRVLKAILGRATLVIGSRFHALVSSLSQGVPCIGAGWSHKYTELFNDFDAAHLLVTQCEDTKQLAELIDSLTEPAKRRIITSKITAAATTLKQQTEHMWSEVESLLRDPKAPRVAS
jgi:polysaccharide pyruvyl transferase WcaK-like protein